MNMRHRLVALVLATAVAAATASAGPANAAPTGQDHQTMGVGVFQQIRNEFSRKCVIPKGNSNIPNAPIVQRTCENRTQHRWALFPTSGGYYWIVNQGSGLCLDLAANSEDEVVIGTRAQQFTCSTAYTSEEWYPISYFGTGIYLFQNKVKGLCIDVLGRSSNNDAPLQVIECKLYETAQQFYYQ
ncbi:RICIN domain-containing protein [Catellatospora vulcania]|uniref:RICIN domain-containing protein n=1 Tax=Catellatospora vulcania TaxID=1460450 RepID=UPI0012D43235|nr:RICIN domain-containing protein [Catellatospora vulcania]